MTDCINRALGCGANRGDTNIYRIGPRARDGSLWEIPLRGAGGRTGTRPGEPDDPALRASHRHIVPALVGRFVKTRGAIVYKKALGRSARKFKRGT